ncbi:MAG: MoxR family ATPase [Xenococcaceae cyanobacterium MO_207.B15]|nr:MoxR family ATPase [Xenococcaceae cyanobacterium MO_207.B15]
MINKKKEPSQEPDYKYKGEYQAPRGTQDSEGRTYDPYIPSEDLKEAVNLAIALERPLLLEGEPGCGKTRLAGAVAYEFTKKYLKDEKGQEKWWDYYIWNIKSTTRARDGLYRYDAVARLRDAQLMGTDPKKLDNILDEDFEELKQRLKDKKNYRKFEPLGKALDPTNKHSYRPILLIDEIDKADSDFPNNLLLELEELRFEIPETEESFPPPKQKPIIFITSNREKPLPEAFLRRCIYFYVDFPKQDTLKLIIEKRFDIPRKEENELRDKVLNLLDKIRDDLNNNPGSKPPGTSELIDFFTVISQKKNPSKNLDKLFKKMALLGILLKTKQDQDFITKKKNLNE